jgi:hypothetical protein
MEVVIVDVATAQVDAYNAHDINRFLACYAPDAVIEYGTGRILMRGREAMSSFYGKLFTESPALRCEIQQRIRVGSYAVDEEADSLSSPLSLISLGNAKSRDSLWTAEPRGG